jgi:DNA polymerase III subunit chi
MEVLFYHLQKAGLDQVLPSLLEKTLERGWKAVVRASSNERLKALDDHLWAYRDDAFLPHCIDEFKDEVEHAPIILTLHDTRYNDAEVIFVVDGADMPETSGWSRAVLMFDGNDQDARNKARAVWKKLKADSLEATYWRQNDEGRWEKMG